MDRRAFLKAAVSGTLGLPAGLVQAGEGQMTVAVNWEWQLLAALHAEGGLPRGRFRRSSAVLRCALAEAGRLTEPAARYLEDGDGLDCPEDVRRLYGTLVRLVHGAGRAGPRLVEGEGNFGCWGDPEQPPAHPQYTACRLTRPGARLAEGP
jgi:hypothetical protein